MLKADKATLNATRDVTYKVIDNATYAAARDATDDATYYATKEITYYAIYDISYDIHSNLNIIKSVIDDLLEEVT